MSWKKEIDEIQKKEREKRQIQEEMKKLQDGEVSALKAQKEDLLRQQAQLKQELEELIGKREADPIEYYISDDYIAVEGETSLKEIIATIDYDVSGIIPVIQHDRKLLGYLTKSIILATMSKQFVPEHTAGERSGVICPATL